jgi:hypothetical protein
MGPLGVSRGGSGVAYNPCAHVTHSANQSIPDATLTAVAFDTERFDTDVIHDTATNNSRLTCKTAGKYRATFAGKYADSDIGYRTFGIYLNGATLLAETEIEGPFSVTVDLIVGDYLEVKTYQNSGAALNLLKTASYTPEFSIERIG